MTEPDTTVTNAPGQGTNQSASSQVVASIEVENAVKTEDTADGGSDVEDKDAQDEAGDGRPVSNAQYKALKAITEVLSDFKIKKGNE